LGETGFQLVPAFTTSLGREEATSHGLPFREQSKNDSFNSVRGGVCPLGKFQEERTTNNNGGLPREESSPARGPPSRN